MRYLISLCTSGKWRMHNLSWITTGWNNPWFLAKSLLLLHKVLMKTGPANMYPIFFRCYFGLQWWHVNRRRNGEGRKLLLAAIDESSGFRSRLFYSELLELEGECVNSTSHECPRICTHANTRIARPCPSAAGDYVDYRMIRTPLPSTLPSFTLDLSAQR